MPTSRATSVVRLAPLLVIVAWTLPVRPCLAGDLHGRVTACAGDPAFEPGTVQQILPDDARGDLLLVAEHQQVMIIDTDEYHDFQPLVVVSRNGDNFYVTTERSRSKDRKPLVRTSPLPADLAARIAAALPLVMAEASAESGDHVGWQVQSAPRKCVLVVHDMFRTVLGGGASHWIVAMLDGLIELAETRGKRAGAKAERRIRAAIP